MQWWKDQVKKEREVDRPLERQEELQYHQMVDWREHQEQEQEKQIEKLVHLEFESIV